MRDGAVESVGVSSISFGAIGILGGLVSYAQEMLDVVDCRNSVVASWRASVGEGASQSEQTQLT